MFDVVVADDVDADVAGVVVVVVVGLWGFAFATAFDIWAVVWLNVAADVSDVG